MLIAAGGHTVVYGTRGEKKKKKKKIGFSLFEQKKSFGNLYSNVDFLIFTKTFGRVGSYATVVQF